jgi:signal peptide peptidase SppA
MADKKHRNLIAAVYNEPWSILPAKLQEICELVDLRRSGVRFTAEEIAERLESSVHAATSTSLQEQLGSSGSKVAILNVFGTISQRANAFTEASGGTSTEQLSKAFDAAVADESVGSIVLNVDSPGGRVSGVPELADKIFADRGVKPIIAIANGAMDSAAYWIGSAADEIVATPSAYSIGSIGAMYVHQESSAADEKDGIKTTIIRSTDAKGEGSGFEPLSDSAREDLQHRVERVHNDFVAAVARNRGISTTSVETNYGAGRDMLAADALKAGLVDRITTLEQVLNELGAQAPSTTSVSLQEPTGMDSKITQKLVALGLCKEGASEEQQETALQAFFVARGIEKPEEVEKILEVLDAKPAKSTQQSTVSNQQTAVTTEPAADTMAVNDIMAAVKMTALSAEDQFDLSQALIAEAGKLSTGQILDRINTRVAESNPPVGATQIKMVEAETDKLQTAARDAILQRTWGGGNRPEQIYDHKSGEYVAWNPPARPNYGLSSPRNLARQLCIAGGLPANKVLALAPSEVARIVMGSSLSNFGMLASAGGPAYNVSGMFSNLMLDVANITLRRSYDDSRTTFQVWQKEGPSIDDFKAVNRVIGGEIGDPKAIPEDGEFEETTLSDGREQYKLTVWGEIFSSSWQLLVNDSTGAFTEIPMKMGRAMRRKQNRLAYGVLKDNAALADAIALFHASHSNLTTGAGAPSVSTLNTLTQKLTEQTGLDTDSGALNLVPRWLLFGPALMGTVLELLGSTSNPAATSGNPGVVNIWQNGLEPVMEAELGATFGGSDTAWYLVCDANDIDTIEYAFLTGLSAPVVETEVAFERLGMRTRIYHAFGCKALDYRGMQRHDGA